MSNGINYFLIVGASCSAFAAILHFACIFWGTAGFRFLGAGEPIVGMAARGHWYPYFMALLIGGLLLGWSAYAFSATGVLMPPLPYLRLVLVGITAVYLLRGLLFPLLKPMFPGNSETFWWVTAAICLFIGGSHLIGLSQVWQTL